MNDLNQTVDHSGREPVPTFSAESTPKNIGRYRIDRVLGKGGFGLVYLAHDDQLQRLVAIKVPHRNLVERHEAAEAYLTEARTVANLDHPHIVPVYDVGSTADCPCFVVSKYIDGTDLATRLKQSRLSLPETVELVATVAAALHHAHKQGLVHRDIKPGNLLLDKSGKPFVADFGLALREQDVGKGPRYAGTPAYMSPEQARGEGHRVDGRSDIFSLGVVFYELLVGRQPFRGESQAELLEQVTSFEARPPRQYDDSIQKELERICLKVLSKRASERYSTAKDMADDLRHFLAEQTVIQEASGPFQGERRSSGASVSPLVSHSDTRPSGLGLDARLTPTPTSDHQPIKIVPKGLRSFDAHDADFFLELLSDIKGHMRSYAELLEASGYGSRPKEFDDLLRILDNEIRLITPADSEGKDASSDSFEKGKVSHRLRVAAVLAKYDPESEKWAKANGPVVEQLVAENPMFLGLWMKGFRPIKGKLLEPLKRIYGNPDRRESQRSLATNILADYAADQPRVLDKSWFSRRHAPSLSGE